MVLQPTKNLVFTLITDIKVKNQITTISETAIFGDPEKYADKLFEMQTVHSIISIQYNKT